MLTSEMFLKNREKVLDRYCEKGESVNERKAMSFLCTSVIATVEKNKGSSLSVCIKHKQLKSVSFRL